MNATLTAIRAIGAEFARRRLRVPVAIGLVVAVALLILGGWLTTQSAWWWLLEATFILGTLVLIAVVIIASIILRVVAPPLSRSQKRGVQAFVDKLERVAETVQMPQPVIIYYVVRDTIRPRSGGFIETVARDSQALGPDFDKLRREL